jgi:hypothetical protein
MDGPLRLVVLTFIVSTALGVFEVGVALRGTQQLNLTPYQIAVMFTECSLVMFAAQAVVFSPWISADTTRWFIAPALLALMAGLFFVPGRPASGSCSRRLEAWPPASACYPGS